MSHGILTPKALAQIDIACATARAHGVLVALPVDATQALIDEIIALRAHVLHLLPVNWDEVPEARDAIAHLRMTCGRDCTEALLLACGLAAVDPEPKSDPEQTLAIIHPGDSEGGAP